MDAIMREMAACMEILIKGAAQLGLQLSHEQIERFQIYYRELMDWNRRMNITAIVGDEEVQRKHFLDSLTLTLVLDEGFKKRGTLLDVGSGGGAPGIPLKVAFPRIHVSLLDSVAKKTAFLRHLVEALGLTGVEVYTGRAEELGLKPQLRERFDVVVARGVAPTPVLMEITLPFCRVGGIVIALKKGDIRAEVEGSLHAMEVLGGKLRERRGVEVEGLEDGRALVVIDKIKPTPAKFPRRPGLPAKHPL